VLLRYAIQVNGFSELVMTKLDVLSGFESLQIAKAYLLDGEEVTTPPSTPQELERAQPVYETLPGWTEPLGDVRVLADLPANARRYIERVSELAGVKIPLVSVGPERDQLVYV
jgi:adenylosuccinate synthase